MLKMWYKDQLVLTTEQLATIYGTTPNSLLQNFKRNPEWFEAERHYIKLSGDELREFKAMLENRVTESHSVVENRVNESHSVVELDEAPDDPTLKIPTPTVGKRAGAVSLWTRRGMLRHSHFLTTAEALHITEQMEDAYFMVTDGRARLAVPQTLTFNGELVWTIEQAMSIFGKTKGQIASKLQSRKFTRPKDLFVTTYDQLRQLRAENQYWFRNCLTLITERGMQKLRAAFEPVQQNLFETTAEVSQDVKNFGAMLKRRAEALIDAGNFLKVFGTQLSA